MSSDDMLRTTYEWKLAASDPRRAECVTPEALLAVIDGTAAEAERMQTLRHVGSCRHCRSELELLRATRETAEMAVQPAKRRFIAYATAAAAVVLIAGGIALRQFGAEPARTFRDAVPGAVRLIGPADDAAASIPVTLAWAPVAGARRYEVEILGVDGSAVFTARTTDTTVVVPADVPLLSGAQYRWWVGVTRNDGSQVRSLARTLRIAP